VASASLAVCLRSCASLSSAAIGATSLMSVSREFYASPRWGVRCYTTLHYTTHHSNRG
jgi:hypothetical protein